VLIHPVVGIFVFVVGGAVAVASYIAFDRTGEARGEFRQTGLADWIPALPTEGPPVPRLFVRRRELGRALLGELTKPYWEVKTRA